MRTEDILNQIDSTLDDWSVSDDAMRSRPTAEPLAMRGAVPTMQIMDEVGEWQEVGGVTSVDIHLATDTTQFDQAWENLREHTIRIQLERARRAQIAMDMLVREVTESITPAAEAAAKGMAELEKAFQQPQQCSEHSQLRRPRDRPAWQSPYGPAQRRRR